MPIIQAFAKGKDIEYRTKGFNENWKKVTQIPELSFKSFEYRIKPEPKYRPFKDAKECMAEMLKHQPFGWVKDNKTQSFFVCKSFGNLLLSIGIEDKPYNYNEVLRHYTFADGTPFGVKEEE